AFPKEEEAFETYAAAMPNNCVFLVDTYNSIRGIQRAIATGQKLREQGHEMVGIRLDSGDLADLSYQARKMLDEAGFPDAKIVASDDLDEYRITELNARGARIDIWGIGTRLVTAYDQPALGGVYKLAALRAPGEAWRYSMKISEKTIKSSQPGILQVMRYQKDGAFAGDMIYNLESDNQEPVFHSLTGPTIDTTALEGTPVLQPIFQDGKCIYESPSLPEMKAYAQAQLAQFDDKYLRINDPADYPVGLEQGLAKLKKDLRDQLLAEQE
ncbi:MAG: nicotinate phosphoribosyltransferase, partial [Bacteroidota bacterium]